MKNKKNKILMALILSSLFITGCDKEKMQAKREEKIKNAFIQEGETAKESFIPGFNGVGV